MAKLVVVSGPSGAGKTTVVAAALARRPEVNLSISATTRAARPDERDGVNYRFLDEATFDDLVAHGAFLEWANVHGARYGTLKDDVEAALAAGKTVVLEIDVQGARQARLANPDAILVFVEPPGWPTLEARLRGRQTESEAAVALRLRNARAEMAEASDFDHRIVNDDLEAAVTALIRILDGHVSPSRGTPPERES